VEKVEDVEEKKEKREFDRASVPVILQNW